MSTPISNNTNELRSLLNAADALPSMQIKTGTFTTDANGLATVNLGFAPGYVTVLMGQHYTDTASGYQISPEFTAEFVSGAQAKSGLVYVPESDARGYPYVFCGISTEQNGFGVVLQGVNYNFEWNAVTNITFYYAAVAAV